MPSKGKALSVQGDFYVREMKTKGKNKEQHLGGEWMRYMKRLSEQSQALHTGREDERHEE